MTGNGDRRCKQVPKMIDRAVASPATLAWDTQEKQKNDAVVQMGDNRTCRPAFAL